MNLIISFLAIIGILVGSASMVTPIPGGTLLIALSLSALVYASGTAREGVKWLRFRFAPVDQLLSWFTVSVGSRISFIGRALAQTELQKISLDDE